MIMRAHAFNSTLCNVSKKRQAEIAAGTYKPKPRKPMRKQSEKARARTKNYRKIMFDLWGFECFLCGRPDPTGKTLDGHHVDGRINGDDPQRIVPLCNRFCGCKAHNHNGMDARFYELKDQIEQKMSKK